MGRINFFLDLGQLLRLPPVLNINIWLMFSERFVPQTMRQILSRQFIPSEDFIRDMERAARLVHVVKNDFIVRQGGSAMISYSTAVVFSGSVMSMVA